MAGRPAADLRAATGYLFTRLRDLCDRHGVRLLLVIDGDRPAIYRDAHAALAATPPLVAMARELADRLGIELLELQPVFAQDYLAHGRRFGFPHDNHWNGYAHRLVALAVAEALRAENSRRRGM